MSGTDVIIHDELRGVIVRPDIFSALFLRNLGEDDIIERLIDSAPEPFCSGLIIKDERIDLRSGTGVISLHLEDGIIGAYILDEHIGNDSRLMEADIHHGDETLLNIRLVDGIIVNACLGDRFAEIGVCLSLAEVHTYGIQPGRRHAEMEVIDRIAITALGTVPDSVISRSIEPLSVIPIGLDITSVDGLIEAVGRLDGEIEDEGGVTSGGDVNEPVVIDAFLGIGMPTPDDTAIIANRSGNRIDIFIIDGKRQAIDEAITEPVIHLNGIIIDAGFGECHPAPGICIAMADGFLRRNDGNGILGDGEIEDGVTVTSVLGFRGILVEAAYFVAMSIVGEVFIFAQDDGCILSVCRIDGEDKDIGGVAVVNRPVFVHILAGMSVDDAMEVIFLSFADGFIGSIA